MNNLAMKEWHVNPICKVIVGFRNYTTHLTRSKYVSFAIENEPDMCRLLLLLASKKLSSQILQTFPEKLFKQLCDYGLFKPVTKVSLLAKIKQSMNVLNENRLKVIDFNGTKYRVTSFIFMAFYSQLPGKFLRETVILPYWSKKFSQLVFNILSSSKEKLHSNDYSSRVVKRMVKHGLITDAHQLPDTNFFTRECFLSEKLFERLPLSSQKLLPTVSKQDELMINPNIYFNDFHSIPNEIAHEICNQKWILQSKPTIWIRNPINQVLSLCWLTNDQLHILKQLIAGTLAPHQLDDTLFKLFSYVYIITSKQHLNAQIKEWKNKLIELKRAASNEIITIQDIISPADLLISQMYIRHLYDQKYLLKDKANGKTKERYWVHRDDFTMYIHQQICTLLNQFLPSPVKVGHNGITIYKPGAILPKHTDDVLAFNWVMSLPIDTDPIKSREDAWPIYVQSFNGNIQPAMLKMGDGHLINPQMAHWRDELTNHSLGILLLWFVPHDFRGYVNGNWIE